MDKRTKIKQNKFTYDMLNELLSYDPTTGFIYWKLRTPNMFATTKHDGIKCANSFNELWGNKRAFNLTNDGGYKYGKILNVNFMSHRMAWMLYYMEWPKGQIDHINGIKDDNRIVNLRDVSDEVNSKNLFKRKANTSGYSGVNFDKSKMKWRARLRHKGKKIHLGWFDNPEDAGKAIENAKPLYGYTERHGK